MKRSHTFALLALAVLCVAGFGQGTVSAQPELLQPPKEVVGKDPKKEDVKKEDVKKEPRSPAPERCAHDA